MEDALVDFVKTGKFSFTDMVDSMITDLIRFQIQQSITGPLASNSSALLETLGTAVGNYFGEGGGITSAAAPNTSYVGSYDSMVGTSQPFTMAANGNAFNGISGFSNQIVSSPTMFAHSGFSKFADGAGLMGEAGPEAIMPLKRTSNGKLGIASTGGAMSVIVNNFGSEKVETKEGKTASGGKSLTIQIGEAVAGDIKSGGPVARAMKETFGIKPQLAMR
jgi:lambda family phage tail tape measure protein